MELFTARFAVIFALILALTLQTVPLWAKSQQTCRAKKPELIAAYLTFHDARPARKTCNGKRQHARMVAINRSKKHRLMDKWIIPFAYRDKQTGKKVFLKLPTGQIADVMGPGPRSKSNYHIDYYIAGPIPAKYAKANCTTWYFKVVD